jgi:conjugal transfer pilin signal peptidase TrbI
MSGVAVCGGQAPSPARLRRPALARLTRPLRARLRWLHRGAMRHRRGLALLLGLVLYGQMAIAEVSTRFMLAYDPQTHRSLDGAVLYLLDRDVRAPVRGAVFAFRPPAAAAALFPEPHRVKFMKRVVGLPGDRVVVEGGVTRVNGVVVGQGLDLVPFLKADRGFFIRAFTVPEGRFFPMGDTRDSYDGRYYGVVAIDAILGRAGRLL